MFIDLLLGISQQIEYVSRKIQAINFCQFFSMCSGKKTQGLQARECSSDIFKHLLVKLNFSESKDILDRKCKQMLIGDLLNIRIENLKCESGLICLGCEDASGK